MKKLILPIACVVSLTLGAFITKIVDDRPITVEVVNQAEKILGLDFTDAEADSMLSDLNDNRKDFEAMRKITLDNSVAPALYFNPLPVGFEFEKSYLPFKVSQISAVKFSFLFGARIGRIDSYQANFVGRTNKVFFGKT